MQQRESGQRRRRDGSHVYMFVTALALKNDRTWIFRITAQIDNWRERDRNMQDMVCNCLLCSGMYHFAGALCFWMEQFFLNERTEAWINFFWSVFARSVIHLKNLQHSTSIFFSAPAQQPDEFTDFYERLPQNSSMR
jgi:hypothetical protein